MLQRVVGMGVVAVCLVASCSSWAAAAEQWRLTLFLTPACQYNEDVVSSVATFLHHHPEVEGQGVLIASLDELKDMLPHAQVLFGQGLVFAVDAAASDKHGITETPAVTFQKGEQKFCIQGRPDLARVWEHIQGENP